MTDICVKIYRCHLLYAREYWFALLLVLLLLLLLLWHICISDVTSSWFRKWLGFRSAPSHYPEQYLSSETIGLRPNVILQLNETKQTFYQVQVIWKQTRIQILQEYKYYTECMRAIIRTNDGRIIVKLPRMLSTQFVALYKPCKPKPILPTHICITRPQWGKTEKNNDLPSPRRFTEVTYVFRNHEAAKIWIDFLFLLNLGFGSYYPLAAVCSI